MKDQAQRLREIVSQLEQSEERHIGDSYFSQQRTSLPRIITVAASSAHSAYAYYTAHLGVALAKYAPPVLIIDASHGSLNLKEMVSQLPVKDLTDMDEGVRDLDGYIVQGPAGINFMRLGAQRLQHMDTVEREHLKDLIIPLAELKKYFGLVIVHTDVGLSFSALNFILASQEIVLFTAKEDETIKNCYLLIKIVSKRNPHCQLGVVSSFVDTKKQGDSIVRKLIAISHKFLGFGVKNLGAIVNDDLDAHLLNNSFRAIEDPQSCLGKSIDFISENVYNYNTNNALSSKL